MLFVCPCKAHHLPGSKYVHLLLFLDPKRFIYFFTWIPRGSSTSLHLSRDIYLLLYLNPGDVHLVLYLDPGDLSASSSLPGFRRCSSTSLPWSWMMYLPLYLDPKRLIYFFTLILEDRSTFILIPKKFITKGSSHSLSVSTRGIYFLYRDQRGLFTSFAWINEVYILPLLGSTWFIYFLYLDQQGLSCSLSWINEI